jgi:hypothetical protein
MVRETLRKFEKLFPGVTSAWNGKAYYNWRPGDEHIRGGYSFYRIGQYSGFSGIEPLPVGNLPFAGEHTSLNFQGYMEGAPCGPASARPGRSQGPSEARWPAGDGTLGAFPRSLDLYRG